MFFSRKPSSLLVFARHISDIMGGPVEQAILKKLTSSLQPTHLRILNESYMHNVPKGSETHFKVIIVSDKFDDSSPIQMHRQVMGILDEELKNGVHALSIVAKKPSQWTPEEQARIESDGTPKCRGGFGK